jgi:hemoglobin
MRHFDWEIDDSMRDYWLNSMFIAMDKLEIDTNVRDQMMGYFVKVANHMINHG